MLVHVPAVGKSPTIGQRITEKLFFFRLWWKRARAKEQRTKRWFYMIQHCSAVDPKYNQIRNALIQTEREGKLSERDEGRLEMLRFMEERYYWDGVRLLAENPPPEGDEPSGDEVLSAP